MKSKGLTIGVCFSCFLFPRLLNAQPTADASTDVPADSGWVTSLVGSLGITQASYSNWTAGAENTVAYKASLDGTGELLTRRFDQTHRLQVAYGQSKIAGEQIRKIDDLLRYNVTGLLRTRSVLQPLVSVDARTQLADGFDYSEDPEAENRITTFLSPGLFVETIGVGWSPEDWLKLQVGAAAKQTVVTAEDLRTLYGLGADQAVRSEAGFSLNAVGRRALVENVFLTSELSIFQALTKQVVQGADRNLQPDVRWKNLVTMTVNETINVNAEFELFFDKDLSAELQTRQTLALGVGFTLL